MVGWKFPLNQLKSLFTSLCLAIHISFVEMEAHRIRNLKSFWKFYFLIHLYFFSKSRPADSTLTKKIEIYQKTLPKSFSNSSSLCASISTLLKWNCEAQTGKQRLLFGHSFDYKVGVLFCCNGKWKYHFFVLSTNQSAEVIS